MARLYRVSGTVIERSKGTRVIDDMVRASHVGTALRQAFKRCGVTAGASVQVSARVATASEVAEVERAREAFTARSAEVQR